MSDWDAASARMDEVIDDRLADTVQYAVNGTTFKPLPGFVLPFAEGLGLNELDPVLGTRWRVKMRKSLVTPDRSHRLKHPKLGDGEFRPAGEDPDDQGRYWIFDVQKA